jgi:hypothetical protein
LGAKCPCANNKYFSKLNICITQCKKNIGQPPGKLTVDGRKRYLEKSLNYKGIAELCA